MCVCVLTVSVVRINKRKLKMSNQITAFFLSWTHFFSIFRENKSTSHWIHLVVVPSSHSYLISHLSKILRMTVVWAGFSGVNDIYHKMKCDVSLVYVNRGREREPHRAIVWTKRSKMRIHNFSPPNSFRRCSSTVPIVWFRLFVTTLDWMACWFNDRAADATTMEP